MDVNQYKIATEQAVKKRFGKKKRTISNYTPRYPSSAEREFQRIANQYMRLLQEVLRQYLPDVMKILSQQRIDSRLDASDVDNQLRAVFDKIEEELERKVKMFDLQKKIEQSAKRVKKLSVSEWKKVCSKTIGIDLLNDYYNDEFFRVQIERWIKENVSAIKSIPERYLLKMRNTIQNGFIDGRPTRDIAKDIQSMFGIERRQARLLARDQIATLNAQITRFQQEDAGITEYEWSDSRDSRVRDCHRALNGQTFKWSDPPEMWYDTKSKGRVYTGRRCHPGEDYCCRCVALPVFDFATLALPITAQDEE